MSVEEGQFLLGVSFCSFAEKGCANNKQAVEVKGLLIQSKEMLSSVSPQKCFGIWDVPVLHAGLSYML